VYDSRGELVGQLVGGGATAQFAAIINANGQAHQLNLLKYTLLPAPDGLYFPSNNCTEQPYVVAEDIQIFSNLIPSAEHQGVSFNSNSPTNVIWVADESTPVQTIAMNSVWVEEFLIEGPKFCDDYRDLQRLPYERRHQPFPVSTGGPAQRTFRSAVLCQRAERTPVPG
jgi:hypothetical protein